MTARWRRFGRPVVTPYRPPAPVPPTPAEALAALRVAWIAADPAEREWITEQGKAVQVVCDVMNEVVS